MFRTLYSTVVVIVEGWKCFIYIYLLSSVLFTMCNTCVNIRNHYTMIFHLVYVAQEQQFCIIYYWGTCGSKCLLQIKTSSKCLLQTRRLPYTIFISKFANSPPIFATQLLNLSIFVSGLGNLWRISPCFLVTRQPGTQQACCDMSVTVVARSL